jgi:hypothetical protein
MGPTFGRGLLARIGLGQASPVMAPLGTLLAAVALSLAPACRGACPPAPTGYIAHPASCIGLHEESKSCASYPPYQILHAYCTGTLTECTAMVGALCSNNSDCHSFAFQVKEKSGCQPATTNRQQHYQMFRLGNASAVANNQWVAYGRPGQAPGLPPPSPPGPRPSPPPPPSKHGIPAHSDCAVRRLALEFAESLLPSGMNGAPSIFDGLELGTRCNDTRPSNQAAVAAAEEAAVAGVDDMGGVATEAEIYVDYQGGKDTNPGTLAAPVKTAKHGLDLLRKLKPQGPTRALVLRAGIHYLEDTLVLRSGTDDGLSIRAHPGDTGLPWLSGGLKLRGLKWKQSPKLRSVAAAAGIVWEADLASILPSEGMRDLHSLRLHGERATTARYPNARIERDSFPTGYIKKAQAWLPPKTFSASRVVTINASTGPSRQRISHSFSQYTLGIGGPCEIFSPPCSFWCRGTQGFTPSGVVLAPADNRSWADPVGDGAEIFAWRTSHWNNWMFALANASVDAESGSTKLEFGRGGFQGTRPGGASEFFISNVREELDSPNEFFLDRKAAKLLYMPNTTTADGDAAGAPPPSDGFVLTRLRTLISINGTKDRTVRNITIQGCGFRDARATYLDDHGVPSGGDWALQRSGALFLEGTDGVSISNVTMERNDGNAIMVSGHNLRTRIVGNEIRWTGDTAIALWGRTDELSNGGLNGVYADGDHPVGVEIGHNLVHELGAFEKQSSMVFLAKSCGTHIHHNAMFNGPRAGVNINDGFCGGHRIESNIIFNTCRESGDHGPLNSWDRQPFAMSRSPTAVPVPAVTVTTNNLIFADYQGVKALDHDDGSSFFDDSQNVIYMGWGQKTFKPSPGAKRTFDTLILFTTSVLTEHGGETSKEFGEHFYNNTIVFAPGAAGYGKVDTAQQISSGMMELRDNRFFVSGQTTKFGLSVGARKMDLAQLQAIGAETGSTLTQGLPSDAELVAMAKGLLLMV